MRISSLQDLYTEELRALYDAEQQLLKGLPRLAKAAGCQELKDAIEEHADQAEEHASRVKDILEGMRAGAKGRKCGGMTALLAEADELIEADIEPEVLDAGLVAVTQRIEHYEIAAYGCACAFARLMNREEDADLLEAILDDEKEVDEILTGVAEQTVNRDAHKGAAAAEEEEDGESEEDEESHHNADRD